MSACLFSLIRRWKCRAKVAFGDDPATTTGGCGTVPDITRLQATLGYQFEQPALLRQALRHRSAGPGHNQRLEFLGDSVLNFCVTEKLYRLKPACNEGELTRIRASLVNRERLAELAAVIELGDYIIVSVGERRNGAKRRTSILSDTLEAVFGAVYLDGSIAAARDLIDSLYAHDFCNLPDAEALKDPKTRLQEYLLARGDGLPVYKVVVESGKDHQKRFEVVCEAPGQASVAAGGNSRRKAEQSAAEKMLERLHA